MPPSFRHERRRPGGRHGTAPLGLALALLSPTAVCADTQAASPFPQIPLEHHAPADHRLAHVLIGSGVALIGGSFLIAARADHTYDDYLIETEPHRIEELYDRTVLYDGFARSTLIGGQGLIAYGLYLRFIRHPRDARLALDLAPARCALSVRF